MSLLRICVTAVSFVAVARAAIVLGEVNIVGNGTSSVSWSSTDPQTDPEFITIELTNPSFNTQFAVANNIAVSTGTVSFETPQILPGSGYAVQLVNVSNVNDVFAMTGEFAVAEHDVSSSSSSGSPTPTSGVPPSGTSGASNTNAPITPPATQNGATQNGATQNGASPSPTQPSTGQSSSSSSAPPTSTSNTVFNNSGASSLQVPLAALGLVGAAFALL